MEMIDLTLQHEANKVKEAVAAAMVAEGYLTPEKGDEFLGRYAVVLRERSWFGQVFDRLRGAPSDGFAQYNVVKVAWPAPEEDA